MSSTRKGLDLFSSSIEVRELMPGDEHWLGEMKLREADRREFEITSGQSGNGPVVTAAVKSDRCMVALLDGKIVAVWGVWSFQGAAWIWACGSDEMTMYPLTIKHHAEQFFRDCLAKWPALGCFMDSRNTVHARWLRQFKFEEIKDAFQIQGVPFNYFRRERQCVIPQPQ